MFNNPGFESSGPDQNRGAFKQLEHVRADYGGPSTGQGIFITNPDIGFLR